MWSRAAARKARDNERKEMPRVLDPFRFVLIAVAGWMNQRQLQIIDYLREENRVLREQLGRRRMRLAMISAVDWPRRPKVWDGSFWPK
jgi:hypothetical protein